MPGFNQQGPNNQGPMTGRRMGVCANGPMADSANLGNPSFRGMGMGFRRGRGAGQGRGMGMGPFGGRGYGPGYMGAVQPGTMQAGTMENLKLRAEMLESELSSIKEALATLSKPSETE